MVKVKSLNTIIKTFNKTLKDLESLVEQNNNRVFQNQVLIANLENENQEKIEENTRAMTVAENLRGLLGVSTDDKS